MASNLAREKCFMAYASVSEVLSSARSTLETAQLGLDSFLHGNTEAHRTAGLRNAIVFGRAVTNVLQNLRSVLEKVSFDSWYESKRIEMAADPTFKYLYELRSQILKEGTYGKISTSLQINYMDTSFLASIPQPPSAKGFFIGDELGGSGWIIQQPDGSQEKYYASIPVTVDATILTKFVSNTSEKNLEPPHEPIDVMLKRYMTYL